MTKDKFIHKENSGPEGYVVSWMAFPSLCLMVVVSIGVTSHMHKAWNIDGSDMTPVVAPSK